MLVPAGPDYCLAHHGGIREEDEDTCDFADRNDSECELTPLLYDDGRWE